MMQGFETSDGHGEGECDEGFGEFDLYAFFNDRIDDLPDVHITIIIGC